MARSLRLRLACAVLLCAALPLAVPAAATWSIVLCDAQTGEVAIGAATCLVGFNLQQLLPVVRVGKGAGAAQSFVETSGKNRKIIWDGLGAGEAPELILAELAAQDAGHPLRQYGIVDTQGRAITFSGASNGAYAGGVVGTVGTITYAIQGNVITGAPVVLAAEDAVQNTPGTLAQKLMAGMQAARAMGGDGRCSCSPSNPTGCGSPPPSFTKSAHIGFMVVARRGDPEGVCTAATGCASGDYYLEFNITPGAVSQPDPVDQLQDLFDAWALGLIGVPDAVASTATFSAPTLLNNGSASTLTVQVNDWQGAPVSSDAQLSIVHDPQGSAGSSVIGAVQSRGGGKFTIEVVSSGVSGLDRFLVTAVSQGKVVALMPSPALLVQDQRADLNADGIVDVEDLALLLRAFAEGSGGDVDGDRDTDQLDLNLLLASLWQN